AFLDKLTEAGLEIRKIPGGLRARYVRRLKPMDVTTLPYPGFPTDMQAQVMSLMSVTDGISVITEKIYPERFIHISELNRMGANILLEGASAIIKGVKNLSGAPVMASDLRASAALVLAGLVAKGRTDIQRIYHLDRGYENIEEKLLKLGAKVWREKDK
ncbi:MAG: UDP-N-acetylglucosamine 1-carboxyvinyltransferase, partial [Candidatus Omnitrophota bacterium]|nr:UDP-N-acetylglucosamine 1-carboxyvinyltransferase [Candidatus Omnitrophota bacterium]